MYIIKINMYKLNIYIYIDINEKARKVIRRKATMRASCSKKWVLNAKPHPRRKPVGDKPRME